MIKSDCGHIKVFCSETQGFDAAGLPWKYANWPEHCESRQKRAIWVKFVLVNGHLDAFISVHVFDMKFLTLNLYFWVEYLAIATQKLDIFIIYFM